MPKKLVDPKKVVKKTLYNKTLAQVNKLLVASGKKPIKALPKGIQGDTCNCPIAKALKPIGVKEVRGDDILVEIKQNQVVQTITTVESAFTPLVKKAEPKQRTEFNSEPVAIRSGHVLSNPALDQALDTFSDFVTEFDGGDID